MAGYTLSEKIFSRASKKEVRAGEFVMAEIDRAMVVDITGPLVVNTGEGLPGDASQPSAGLIAGRSANSAGCPAFCADNARAMSSGSNTPGCSAFR